MAAILSNTDLLYAAIEANPADVAAWGTLADIYLEQGDEVAYDWCRWVATKGRVPVNHDHHHPNDDNPQWTWGFWMHAEHDHFKAATIPIILGRSTNQKGREWYVGSPTITRAYQFLLEGWRMLTPEQVRQCWEWNP